jgi:hypothetical protein
MARGVRCTRLGRMVFSRVWHRPPFRRDASMGDNLLDLRCLLDLRSGQVPLVPLSALWLSISGWVFGLAVDS